MPARTAQYGRNRIDLKCTCRWSRAGDEMRRTSGAVLLRSAAFLSMRDWCWIPAVTAFAHKVGAVSGWQRSCTRADAGLQCNSL